MRKTDSFGETRHVPHVPIAHHELESVIIIIIIILIIIIAAKCYCSHQHGTSRGTYPFLHHRTRKGNCCMHCSLYVLFLRAKYFLLHIAFPVYLSIYLYTENRTLWQKWPFHTAYAQALASDSKSFRPCVICQCITHRHVTEKFVHCFRFQAGRAGAVPAEAAAHLGE